MTGLPIPADAPLTPDARLKLIQERALTGALVAADDVLFLCREVGLRQQALDLALTGVAQPGRVFGLNEAAEITGSIGRRVQLASPHGAIQLLVLERRLKQYAEALRAGEEKVR